MKPQKQRRKRNRGVILTREGWQKLQNAKLELEFQENSGCKYTLEDLSERAGLTPVTLRRILTREEGVDKRTLVRFFMALNLELNPCDYSKPDPDLARREGAITPKRIDWGEAPDVSVFFGRTEELNTLEQWLIKERCRVVVLLGMGGIGKTSLAAKLTEQIQDRFEYIIWRSLYNAPPLFEFLANLIQFLSNEQVLETDLPESIGGRISRLTDYLRSSRCLLILDNAESLLRSGSRAGQYREGYESYSELFRRVGEQPHKSCLVLTSQEKPKEFVSLEGETLPVRSFRLTGLKEVEGREIFRTKGSFSGSEDEWRVIIEHYAGNPLALKMVAAGIQELLDSNISEFLKLLEQGTFVFDDIRNLLGCQLNRLSDLEKEIMYWLAIEREPISLQQLQENLLSLGSQQKVPNALSSLWQRCLIDKATLIEKKSACFTLRPVVMEYMTERLIEQVCEEITTGKITIFHSHALLKVQGKDPVRDTQIRLILKPVIDNLLTVQNKKSLENKLTQILATLRETSLLEPGYTAGNILNLLCLLETDLSGYDFSELTVWQADLRSVNLHNVNFAHANSASGRVVDSQTK